MNEVKELEFDLIQNATDSIDHAIELLAYSADLKESTRNKRAILAISHGIELFLKERLRRVHPSLIWENVDKYPNLDGRTVNAERALQRLKNIGGVELTQNDEKLLRSLKNTRNSIEHYTWSISKQEAEYIVGSTLSFIIYFTKKYLDYEVIDYGTQKSGTLIDLIESNHAFRSSYEKRNNAEFASTKEATSCGFCKAEIEKSDLSCSKCGHWNYYHDIYDDIPF